MAEVPLLCFDGDAAGQKAAIRAAHRALPLLKPGRSLAFITLPDGLDPDDVVRTRGAGAMEAALTGASPLVERLWQAELAAEPLDTPERRAGLKRRLADLAGAIADPSVRGEYGAEFRARADQLFARPARGPAPRGRTPPRRGAWQPPEAMPGAAMRGVGAGGLDPILARAVLAGLIRHPAEIARHMEVLGGLRSASGALGKLFEAVVDVALEDRQLDSGKVHTILARSGFDALAGDLLRADTLPFSFTRPACADEGKARDDLHEAIAVMVERPAVEAALADATAALMRDGSDAAFERQVALSRRRQELEARLANLMLADGDDFED
jgi:DNA primase